VWDLWWTKWQRGRFSSSISVSPSNSHSTDCSTYFIILDRYNRPISGRHTEWTQSLAYTGIQNAVRTDSRCLYSFSGMVIQAVYMQDKRGCEGLKGYFLNLSSCRYKLGNMRIKLQTGVSSTLICISSSYYWTIIKNLFHKKL
jgi:hypothetical protein